MSNPVTRGIDRLLRLDYAIDRSEFGIRQHEGRTVDVLEMLDSLEVLREFFELTRDMVGKPMYRGEKEFDYIHDIKESIKGFYFAGDSEKQVALNKRKYNGLLVLLLNPIIDYFNRFSHEEALENYNSVIDDAIEHIKNSDITPSADDAFVVRALITKEVQRRNRVNTAVEGIMRLRRRKRSRLKKAA